MKWSKTEKYSETDFLENVDVVSSGQSRDGTSMAMLSVLVIKLNCGK